MLNFPGSILSKRIVTILSAQSLTTNNLINAINSNGFLVSIQAIYKSLKILKKEGVIVMYKKEVSLDQTWLRKIEEFIMTSKYSNKNIPQTSGHFLQMQDGDTITYNFKNALQVDIFWNHVLYSLFDTFPEERHWFAYSKHCWFLVGRKDEELNLRDYMNSKGISYIFSVLGSTKLDKYVAKYFDGKMSKYQIVSKQPIKNRYVGFTVFQDYIVEAKYSKETINKIDNFYQKYTEPTDENILELEKIIKNQSHIKFTIKRNNKQATQLKKTLSKNLYLG